MRHMLLKHSILFLLILFLAACEKKDTIPPGEVVDLTATVGVGEVDLTWTEPVDADLAWIEITQTPFKKVFSQPSGLNGITISELLNGEIYDFAVVAVDDYGNKSDAVQVSALPNTLFKVVDPDPNYYEPSVYVEHTLGYQTLTPSATFGVDLTGAVNITVSFNRPLDISSVLSGQTIYFEGDTISPGYLTFSEDNKTLTFTATEPYSSFGTHGLQFLNFVYTFDFYLIGDDGGHGVIRDSGGMALDGDNNGTPGGNFVLELIVNEKGF